VVLRKIDGRTIMGIDSFLRSGDAVYHLPPGTYTLSVAYSAIWPLEGDEHETLRSAPVHLQATLNAGQRYTIQFAKPDTLDDAREMARCPEFELVDEAGVATGQTVPQPVPSRQVAEAPTPVDQPEGTRQSPSLATGATKTQTPQPGPKSASPGASPLSQMELWWEKASPEEKREFRNWVDER